MVVRFQSEFQVPKPVDQLVQIESPERNILLGVVEGNVVGAHRLHFIHQSPGGGRTDLHQAQGAPVRLGPVVKRAFGDDDRSQKHRIEPVFLGFVENNLRHLILSFKLQSGPVIVDNARDPLLDPTFVEQPGLVFFPGNFRGDPMFIGLDLPRQRRQSIVRQTFSNTPQGQTYSQHSGQGSIVSCSRFVEDLDTLSP